MEDHQEWKTTKMEDDQNGRRPKWKTTKMEDDQNGRRQKWKTTKMNDDHSLKAYVLALSYMNAVTLGICACLIIYECCHSRHLCLPHHILVVIHFGCLPFWSSSILVVLHFGCLPFWSSSILVVLHFGHLTFWSSSFWS